MARTVPTLESPLPRRRSRLRAIAAIAGVGLAVTAVTVAAARTTGDPIRSESIQGSTELFDASNEPIDLRSESFEESVAREGGAVPMVSDRAWELGTIVEVTVKRTPDPDPVPSFMLAPFGEDRARLIVVPHADPATLDADGRLADGRAYEMYSERGAYVQLGSSGAEGQFVEMTGRGMTFGQLVALADELVVTRTSLEFVPAGWTVLGTVPMPPWTDGFSTTYEYLGGRRLGIVAERFDDDRDVLAAFANSEPIELGVGGWAYFFRAPSNGMMFELGDVVVHLTGEFAEYELLTIAHSLRPMEPGEHPIRPPDPWPF